MRIDLNSDCGESYGDRTVGDDSRIIPLLTSANLACGGHGGDQPTMAAALSLVAEHGVRLGAHVSYPDIAGFGREVLALPADELAQSLADQFSALRAEALAHSLAVAYLKPHGALYNHAQTDSATAQVIVDLALSVVPTLAILTMPAGELARVARACGVPVIAEAFADRLYLDANTLAPRTMDGAVHRDVERVVAQAVALATGEEFASADGSLVRVKCDSVCVHSDSPGALEFLSAIRKAFVEQGVEVRA